MKLVMIDDEEILCKLFPRLFNLPGVEISTFSDPFTALRACRDNPPDMVFTDEHMGSMNGEEFAKSLKMDIPIYLLSGGSYQLSDFKYPFIDILEKPMDMAKITAIITTYRDQNQKLKIA